MLASDTVLALRPCLYGKVSSVIGVYWMVSHAAAAQELCLPPGNGKHFTAAENKDSFCTCIFIL